MTQPMTTRRPVVSLLRQDEFARRSGLHPDLVRRFVALGLLRASRDANGALWFTVGQLAAVARIERLRTGLSLNYTALGLVVDLLDRVQELELTLSAQPGRDRRRTGRTEPDRSVRWI
ncbi:MAG: chaperone modulatory protein CbpM [Pseudonocardiales bacterium]|jgi:chaperone modulatory protein CbpM|nr:chaperone modulatory protein CbpM [Pseudonocardiales bacterium]